MIKNTRGANLQSQENERILQLNKSLKPLGFSQACLNSVSGGQLQTRHTDSPCVLNKHKINNDDNRWSCGPRTKMGFKWKSLLTDAGGQTQTHPVLTRRSERPTGPWHRQPADAKADLWGVGRVNYLQVVKRYCLAEYYYFNKKRLMKASLVVAQEESFWGQESSYIILSAAYVFEYQQKIYCLNINLGEKLKLIKKV